MTIDIIEMSKLHLIDVHLINARDQLIITIVDNKKIDKNCFLTIHILVFEILTKHGGPHDIRLSMSVLFASLSSKLSDVNFVIPWFEDQKHLSYLFNIDL